MCSLCGAGPDNRYRFSRFACAIGKVSHPRRTCANLCGLCWPNRHSLTGVERPLDSALNLVACHSLLRTAGKQGTPVRFRDGPAAVTKRRSRLIRAIAGGARASVARRHPAGGAWESEDLPVFESRPNCEGRAAGTVAQAAGNASSITGRRHPRAVAAPLRPRVAVSAWIRRRSRCVGRAVRQG